MPNPTITQTNFTGGEMSRSVFGRTDIGKYSNALQKCSNYSVQTRGALVTRPGTSFVDSVDGAVRLISFTAARNESYIMAFGGGYVTFFRSGGQVFGPLAVPYSDEDIPNIQHAQSVDIMWLVHPDYPIQEIRRTGVDEFTLVAFEFNGPYGENRTKGGTEYNIDLNISAGPPSKATSGDPIFSSGDVGVIFLAQDSITGKWGSWRIVNYVGPYQVEIESVTSSFTSGPVYGISSNWRFPAWGGADGYPASVALHQQRLWFGGSTGFPQNVWGSRVSDFGNFQPFDGDGNVLDDTAINLSIDSDVGDAVQWISPSQRGLVMGTEFGEHILRGDGGKPITPSSVTVLRQGTHGSRQGVRPIQTSRGVVYAHHTGLRVMELFYSIQSDGYVARDLTLLADHVCAGLIKEMSWGKDPDNKLVVVMEDNSLWLCTYDSDQEVIAWHQYVLSGDILSCAYAREDGDDILHVLVSRNNGTYVERFSRFGTQGDSVFAPVPLDSSLLYIGPPASTLTGLAHLEGESVMVVDSSLRPEEMRFQGPYVVSGGQVNIDEQVSDAVVGLGFECEAVTMPIQPTTLGFDIHSRVKSIARVHANVQGCMFLQASHYGCEYDIMDNMREVVEGSWKKHKRVYDIVETAVQSTMAQLVSVGLKCDRPVHSTISAVSYEIKIGGPQ